MKRFGKLVYNFTRRMRVHMSIRKMPEVVLLKFTQKSVLSEIQEEFKLEKARFTI